MLTSWIPVSKNFNIELNLTPKLAANMHVTHSSLELDSIVGGKKWEKTATKLEDFSGGCFDVTNQCDVCIVLFRTTLWPKGKERANHLASHHEIRDST